MLAGFRKSSLTSALHLDSVRNRVGGIFRARLSLRPGTGIAPVAFHFHGVGSTDGGLDGCQRGPAASLQQHSFIRGAPPNGDTDAVAGTDAGDGDTHDGGTAGGDGDGVYTRQQVRDKLHYLLHPKRPEPRRTGGYQLPLPVDLSVVQWLLREDHYDVVANFDYMNMEEPRSHTEYLLLLLDALNKERLVLFVNDRVFFSGCHGSWHVQRCFGMVVLFIRFHTLGHDMPASDYFHLTFRKNDQENTLWECSQQKLYMRGGPNRLL